MAKLALQIPASQDLIYSVKGPVSDCGLVCQVGVSMVLSFMVVWDLPAISKGISSLRSSRLSAIYNEVAPSLSVFGMLFGKALQAQVSTLDVLLNANVTVTKGALIAIQW